MLKTINIIGNTCYQADWHSDRDFWQKEENKHDGIFTLPNPIRGEHRSIIGRSNLMRLLPTWADMAWNWDYVLTGEDLHFDTGITSLSFSTEAVIALPTEKATVHIAIEIPDVTNLHGFTFRSLSDEPCKRWEEDANQKAQQLIDWYAKERDRKRSGADSVLEPISLIDAGLLLASNCYYGNPSSRRRPLKEQEFVVYDAAKPFEKMERIAYLDYVSQGVTA